MFETRYRITTDGYNGYETKYKYWWWPIWLQVERRATLEDAKKVIELHKNRRKIVYEE